MREFWTHYSLFAAEVLTVLAAVLLILGRIGALIFSARGQGREKIRIRHINRQQESMIEALQRHTLPPTEFKQHHKQLQAERKNRAKGKLPPRRKVFVLDFHGDIRASAVASLRQEVTAVLGVAQPDDEVLLRLETGGGLVHSYGLAASQLARLKEKNVRLTVAVDKVAASGGYMMACVADTIVAAPFAILGSIGVVAQIPNINRLLKKHDVDFELHTAGKFKRTLTMLGENTDEGRQKFQEELEDTHLLFQEFVGLHRPQVDLAVVATGEHWYGTRAKELGLCDELRTSDDYVMAAVSNADVFEVKCSPPGGIGQRFGAWLRAQIELALSRY